MKELDFKPKLLMFKSWIWAFAMVQLLLFSVCCFYSQFVSVSGGSRDEAKGARGLSNRDLDDLTFSPSLKPNDIKVKC
jgi:hypothetical protein